VRFLRRNAIALTALVFAMTGTGIAASRYIITSTSQIKPSVIHELRSDPEAISARVPYKFPSRGMETASLFRTALQNREK
jgi:hypothetical protein